MQSLKDRLAEAMRRHPNLKQADVARACQVKTPSVTDWFNGKTKSLGPKASRLAGTLFGCDQNWIGQGVGTPNWKKPDTDESPSAPATTTGGAQAQQAPVILTPQMVANALCDLIERLDDGARERVWGRLSTAARAPDSQDARAKLAAELQPLTPPTRLTPTPAPAPAPLIQKQHRTGTK